MLNLVMSQSIKERWQHCKYCLLICTKVYHNPDNIDFVILSKSVGLLVLLLNSMFSVTIVYSVTQPTYLAKRK